MGKLSAATREGSPAGLVSPGGKARLLSAICPTSSLWPRSQGPGRHQRIPATASTLETTFREGSARLRTPLYWTHCGFPARRRSRRRLVSRERGSVTSLPTKGAQRADVKSVSIMRGAVAYFPFLMVRRCVSGRGRIAPYFPPRKRSLRTAATRIICLKATSWLESSLPRGGARFAPSAAALPRTAPRRRRPGSLGT